MSGLIDWLAGRPEVQLDAKGDPRVGVTGASYGGAVSLLAAGYDDRVDAIAPVITYWNLADALFPDGVFKKLWAGIFVTSGGGCAEVPEAAVRDVRAGRRQRQTGRRRARTPDGTFTRGRGRPHRRALADRPGPERLPVPARPGRRHGQGHQGQRRARLRRLDRGRTRRRGRRGRPRPGPGRRLVRPLPEEGQGRRHRPRVPRHPDRRRRLHRRRRPEARREQRHVPRPEQRRAEDHPHRRRAAARDRRGSGRSAERPRRRPHADLPQPRRWQPALHLRRPRRRRRALPAVLARRRVLPRLPRAVRPLRLRPAGQRRTRHRVADRPCEREGGPGRRRAVRQGLRRLAGRETAGPALPARRPLPDHPRGAGQAGRADPARRRPRGRGRAPPPPRPLRDRPRLRLSRRARDVHRLPRRRP